MRVTYVADSTYLFEHRGYRILTDPWIGTRIHSGAWIQFPRPTLSPADIGPVDAVFISRLHEDHCDLHTLARLDLSRANLLVTDRSPNFTVAHLEHHGITFAATTLLDAGGAPTEIAPGLNAHSLDADPSHEIDRLLDSGLMLTWDGDQAVYFAGGCRPHEGTFAALDPFRVRFAALPASNDSGYPACFDNISTSEKASERTRVIDMHLDEFVAAVERIRPARIMACAGNHVVVGLNEEVERFTTFLPTPALAYRHGAATLDADDQLAIRVLALREGEVVDLAVAQGVSWEAAGATVDADIDIRRSFLDSWRGATLDHEVLPMPDVEQLETAFTQAAEHLLRQLERRSMRSMSTILVALDAIDDRWGEVDLSCREARVTSFPNRDGPTLSIRTDLRVLHELLSGRLSWRVADAALVLRYQREPDVHDHDVEIALTWLRRPMSADDRAAKLADAGL